jgi:uridylate kinase
MKKTIVFSLGGSLIVPDKIEVTYLRKFSKFLKIILKDYKVVIVTGGGSIARKYIQAIRANGLEEPYTSIAGIESTKLNAALVGGFLKQDHLVPDSLEEVKKELNKDGLVVCGALGFQPDMTSDGDAAQIAAYLKADYFVNFTDVDGLYTKNPKLYSTAQFIPEISFLDFNKRIAKIKFKAGQHFVLDQSGAKIVLKHKIKTLIINGKKLGNLKKFLDGKKFRGTLIQ